MAITIEFKPWRPFLARKRSDVVNRWLRAVGDASVKAFTGGMGSYPPASAPGDWPAVRSGKLQSSVRAEVTNDSMTVGSNQPYSIYLRMGTRKMARRKMSDDALKEGMRAAGGRLNRWVEWSRS